MDWMPDPNPGVKITPDPASGSATLVLLSGLATDDGYTVYTPPPPPLHNTNKGSQV